MESRISNTFKRLSGKRAFIPYIMAGDPDLERTLENILMLEACGADIIELGVPFSDPLADGPTIQRAAERALRSGTNLKKIISFVEKIRQKTYIPIVFMTYYNPVFKYGEEEFIKNAISAGVDGVIIPDLPVEEGRDFIKLSRNHGLDTIFLIAPTSTEKRIKKIVSKCRGFIYYVSITGITGAKLLLDETIKEHIRFIKSITDTPVCVGFGVSTPEEASMVADFADGVIIGSAIVKRLYEHPRGSEEFIKKLSRAIKSSNV